MSSITEFFLLEARESLDGLERVLDAATESDVDAAQLHRLTRALRGSAQLARQSAIREIAGSLENEARSITQGRQQWSAVSLEHARDGLRRLRHLIDRVAAGEELPATAAEVEAAEPSSPAGTEAGARPEQEETPVSDSPPSLTGTLVEQAERLAGELAAMPEPGERVGDLVALLTRIRDRASSEGLAEAAALAERAMARLQMGGTAAVVALMPRLAQVIRDGDGAAAPGIAAPAETAPAGEPTEREPPPIHRWEDGVDVDELDRGAADRQTEGQGEPPPSAPAGDEVVPIEDLCYRGDRALERALSLRDTLEHSGSLPSDASETLDEIFDLIRLGMK